MINKGKAVKRGEIWGLGAYHGQSDFAVTNESDAHFKKYLQDNNIKRKYLHYAWTREAIRVANHALITQDIKKWNLQLFSLNILLQ